MLDSFDFHLFTSTFALIFLAELPDKTAFATLLLATRNHPMAVFIGVAAAFVVQSIIAVTFGTAIGLLPHKIVHIVAALLFFVFAWMSWNRKEEHEDKEFETQEKFWKTALSSFVVIFIAEWGDLTQLATAALTAHYRQPFTIFLSATLSLWTVTGLAILVGNKASKIIKESLLKKIAAGAFVLVGLYLLAGALK